MKPKTIADPVYEVWNLGTHVPDLDTRDFDTAVSRARDLAKRDRKKRMSDMGDTFRAFRKACQEKREKNREASTEILRTNNVPFESHNNGEHLVVGDVSFGASVSPVVDFWPGTGKFIFRADKKKGRGVFNLMSELRRRGHIKLH